MSSRGLMGAVSLVAFLAVVLGTATPSLAGFEDARSLPVQEGGRVKPFDTYARDLVSELSGKEAWDGHSATAVAMSIMADGETWKQTPIIKVEYLALKEKFDLKREQKHFSFDELLSRGGFIDYAEGLQQSGREDFDDLEKAALETYHKMLRLDMAARGMTPHPVPFMNMGNQPAPEEGEPRTWFSLGQIQSAPFFSDHRTQWEELQAAALSEDPARTQTAMANWMGLVQSHEGFVEVDPRKIEIEVFYNSLNPFRKAWMLYIVAFVVFLAGWVFGNPKFGFFANFILWAGFVFHTLGLLARQYIAGRPPISNLYEALVFIVWGLVVMAILFELKERKRIHGTIAAVLGSIGLVLAEIMPIERQLNPLVAVLRSYWMQYHVTTILLSYSALTLAAGLAHFHLAVEWFAPHRKQLSRKSAELIYTSMKIGVTFLGTGIILGAWWASESWGRYWGWDPKETWSLITLMGYVAILHGRFAGWLNPYGVSVANVACWGLVLFTFYGVNFFLVGLHSYAGEAAAVKLPPLLVAYLVFEVIVVAIGVWYTKSGRLRARRTAVSH